MKNVNKSHFSIKAAFVPWVLKFIKVIIFIQFENFDILPILSNVLSHFGHAVDDCPRCYGGTQAITTTHGRTLPLSYCSALCRITLRKPTKKELDSYIPKELTNPMPWNPTLEYDSDPSLDHNLASVNMLLPIPTGEGDSVAQEEEEKPLTKSKACRLCCKKPKNHF